MGAQTDFDILIIGGGMVGAALACALGPTGLAVGVVEAVDLGASSQPSYDDRTVALAYGSRRIFEGMGVWPELARRSACPIRRIHVSDRGHFGITRLDAAEMGIEALGYVAENRVLGAVLYEALGRFDTVSLHCPATMEGLAFHDRTAEVTVRHEGAVRTLTARLVVGADGGDSAVRAAAGLSAQRREYAQRAVVTNVTPTVPHGNAAYERFTRSGPLALLPMADGRCAVVWSALADEVEEVIGWNDAQFLEQLQARFGDRLGAFRRVGKRHLYTLYLTRVPVPARPRLVVIGNAAHTVHPVAGQGFNLGLRDVAALSQVLLDAHRAGRDLGDLEVLREYSGWRRRDNRVITTFTDGLLRAFTSGLAPVGLARNLGLIAVDLCPPVKRGFMRVTSGLAGRLPRLARGLPLL